MNTIPEIEQENYLQEHYAKVLALFKEMIESMVEMQQLEPRAVFDFSFEDLFEFCEQKIIAKECGGAEH